MLTKNHAKLAIEVAAHVAADAVIGGKYWEEDTNLKMGGTGCFIGCLAHSANAGVLGDMYGLPLILVKISESIFEDLSQKDRVKFFADFPVAVGRDGKDLSKVHWQFLASILRGLPPVAIRLQKVIDPVIAGMDLLADGKEWPDADAASADAAYAAAYAYAAARAARAAADAAYAAAYADAAAYAAAYADAADAAYAAAYAYAYAYAAARAARAAAARAAADADADAYAAARAAAARAADAAAADAADARRSQAALLLDLIKNAPG